MSEGDRRWYKNAPKLRLVTMPHTGTVFTRYVLGLMGLFDRREETGDDYLSHHTYEFDYPWLVIPDDARVIVPLRDPMLAECSRVNRGQGAHVSGWEHILRLRDPHFFRVPPPDSDTASELARLAAYVGAEPPRVDWSPQNSRPDLTGVKSAYRRGEITPELAEAWDYLTHSEPLNALFRAQGYRLPWMED